MKISEIKIDGNNLGYAYKAHIIAHIQRIEIPISMQNKELKIEI